MNNQVYLRILEVHQSHVLRMADQHPQRLV